jgi:hypothetical protein
MRDGSPHQTQSCFFLLQHMLLIWQWAGAPPGKSPVPKVWVIIPRDSLAQGLLRDGPTLCQCMSPRARIQGSLLHISCMANAWACVDISERCCSCGLHSMSNPGTERRGCEHQHEWVRRWHSQPLPWRQCSLRIACPMDGHPGNENMAVKKGLHTQRYPHRCAVGCARWRSHPSPRR